MKTADVTVKHVSGEIEYIFADRVYEITVRLEYDRESAWPDADECMFVHIACNYTAIA